MVSTSADVHPARNSGIIHDDWLCIYSALDVISSFLLLCQILLRRVRYVLRDGVPVFSCVSSLMTALDFGSVEGF